MNRWADQLHVDDQIEWFDALEAEPMVAVDDLLAGAGDLGGADPVDIALAWLWRYREVDNLVDTIDVAFVLWIRQMWGSYHNDLWAPGHLPVGWARLFDIVAEGPLHQSGHELFRRHSTSGGYLRPMARGRTLDPFERYLEAVAMWQSDDRLRYFWWRLCDLDPPSLPHYYGPVGVMGIRGLPAPTTDAATIAAALTRLASSLAQRVDSQLLSVERAEAEFISILSGTVKAYPQVDWSSVFSSARATVTSEVAAFWFRTVLPDVNIPVRRRRGGGRSDSRDDFRAHGEPLRKELEHAASDRLKSHRINVAIDKALALIQEEDRHAAETGDTYPLARSLASFGQAIVAVRPELSSLWAARAIEVDPKTPHPWSTLGLALSKLGRFDDAELVMWRAIERFPGAEHCWTRLAQLIAARGDVQLSVLILWEAHERFSQNGAVAGELGYALLAAGRPTDARWVFLDATRYSPKGSRAFEFAWNGLAKSLLQLGQIDRAAEFFESATRQSQSPRAHYESLLYLARCRLRQRRQEEAVSLYERALNESPSDRRAWVELVELLMRHGQPDAARAVLSRSNELFAADEELLALSTMLGIGPAQRPQPGWEGPESERRSQPVTRSDWHLAVEPAEPVERAEGSQEQQHEDAGESVSTLGRDEEQLADRSGPVLVPATHLSASAFSQLAYSLERDQRLHDALTIYETAIGQYPQDVPLSVGYARVLLALGRAKEALQTLLALSDGAQADPDVRRLRRAVLLAQGSLAAAHELTRRSTEDEGANALTRLLDSLGRPVHVDALGRARLYRWRAVRDPENREAHLAAAVSYSERLRGLDPDDPDSLSQGAAVALDARRVGEATDIAGHLRAISPDTPAALLLESRMRRERSRGAHYTLDRLREAVEPARELRTSYPFLAPTASTEELRLAFAMVDSDALVRVQERTLERAASAFSRPLAGYPWSRRQLRDALFGLAENATSRDLRAMEDRLSTRGELLDLLEDSTLNELSSW